MRSPTKILITAAVAGLGIGRSLGMSGPMIAGTFAGAATNTPALAAAGNAAAIAGYSDGAAIATVGYAVAYLYGVIGMLFFCLLALRYRRSDKDAPSPLVNRTIRVGRAEVLTPAARRAGAHYTPGPGGQALQGRPGHRRRHPGRRHAGHHGSGPRLLPFADRGSQVPGFSSDHCLRSQDRRSYSRRARHRPPFRCHYLPRAPW